MEDFHWLERVTPCSGCKNYVHLRKMCLHKLCGQQIYFKTKSVENPFLTTCDNLCGYELICRAQCRKLCRWQP